MKTWSQIIPTIERRMRWQPAASLMSRSVASTEPEIHLSPGVATEASPEQNDLNGRARGRRGRRRRHRNQSTYKASIINCDPFSHVTTLPIYFRFYPKWSASTLTSLTHTLTHTHPYPHTHTQKIVIQQNIETMCTVGPSPAVLW